jgi:hypothetical protein
MLGVLSESVRNMLNYSLQYHYQLVVLPHRISKMIKALFGFKFKSPASGYQQAAPVLNGPLDGCVDFHNRLLCVHVYV